MCLAVVARWVVVVVGVFAIIFVGLRILYSRDLNIVEHDDGALSSSGKQEVFKKGLAENESSDYVLPVKTLHSKAGVVINANTGKVIYAENAFEVLPMASITKLMSSMVAIDNKIGLEAVVTIPPDDYTIGGNLRIVAGRETVSVKDLFYASITGSANNAALAIAKLAKLSEVDFVSVMNRKAVELGLESLHFQEASGLSSNNSGSAYDVARMAGYAFLHYPLIMDAASQKEYKITTKNTKREHIIKNPNELFARASGQFVASKTGYLDEALYCLVLAKNTQGGMIVAVTLGNADKQDGENETLDLLKKGESAFLGAVN
jgi:D-alanyl-D-alanine endopeptidase (penicillin-binding protein 7)